MELIASLLSLIVTVIATALPMLFFVGFFGLLIWLIWWGNSQHEKAMASVAEQFDLTHHEGRMFGTNARVEGQHGSCRVVIDTYTTGSGKSRSTWTRFRLDSPRTPYDAHVSGEGVLSFVGKAFKGNDIQIGDARFDDKVLLRGPEAELRAMLDADTRESVRNAVIAHWELSSGTWTCRRSGRMRDARQMANVLSSGLAAAEGFTKPDIGAARKLEEIYRHDPHPKVRAKALRQRMGMKPLPDEAELRRIAAEDDGYAGLMAAQGLKEEGIAYLTEALHKGDPADVRLLAAELLIEMMGVHDVPLEPIRTVLMQAVQHEPYIDRAIEGLWAVGTVEAVPLLNEHADGFMPSARKTAAKKAVRAIQSRIAGAGRGQVSFAKAAGGELSMADRGARRPKVPQ
jgi:hypothetical protein